MIERQLKIRALRPEVFRNIIISEEEILDWLDCCEAIWLHNGDNTRPHAELSSGLCSNGFFDLRRVLKHPNLCEILACQLVKKLEREEGIMGVDWVIGSPYSAITISHEVARQIGAMHGFCEKDPSDPQGKRMVWRGEIIPSGSKILQAEELVTTSATFKEIRRALTEAHCRSLSNEFLPVVGALVHRPPKLTSHYENVEVISLIEKEVWAVDPSQCHLCKAGSRRLRPRANWQELTGN